MDEYSKTDRTSMFSDFHRDEINEWSSFEYAEQFVARSNLFLAAYDRLTDGDGGNVWVAHFILCHALELSLKAFLLCNNISISEVRTNYGHDIQKLLSECENKNIALDASDRENIRILDDIHKRHVIKYPSPGNVIFMSGHGFALSVRRLNNLISDSYILKI